MIKKEDCWLKRLRETSTSASFVLPLMSILPTFLVWLKEKIHKEADNTRNGTLSRLDGRTNLNTFDWTLITTISTHPLREFKDETISTGLCQRTKPVPVVNTRINSPPLHESDIGCASIYPPHFSCALSLHALVRSGFLDHQPVMQLQEKVKHANEIAATLIGYWYWIRYNNVTSPWTAGPPRCPLNDALSPGWWHKPVSVSGEKVNVHLSDDIS